MTTNIVLKPLAWLALMTVLWALPVTSAGAAGTVTDLTSGTPDARTITRALTSGDGQESPAIALDVQFAFDSARLTENARAVLGNLAEAMTSSQLDGYTYSIEGHTDATGRRLYNIILSEQRANSVFGFLVATNVAPTRLTTSGYGPDLPLAGVPATSPRNRRVEIKSIPPKPTAQPEEPVTIRLDYEIHRLTGNGTEVVDPTKTLFKAGDKIFLQFASNLSGVFDIYNETPSKKVNKLGTWTMSGPDAQRLPPAGDSIEFTGETGTDLLVLQFYPCKSEAARDLRISPEVDDALPTCADLADRSYSSNRSRDLTVTSDSDGATAETEVPAADVAAAAQTGFVVSIPLKHE